MKCPKCNKTMNKGFYITLGPKLGSSGDYWFCSNTGGCGYEMTAPKVNKQSKT
jgi:hypothetical protein